MIKIFPDPTLCDQNAPTIEKKLTINKTTTLLQIKLSNVKRVTFKGSNTLMGVS
jgi:hypothetical protein